MAEAEKNGWVKIKAETHTKEEDIQALFNMIDKDKSGSLSKKVGPVDPLTAYCTIFNISGSEKGGETYQKSIWNFGCNLYFQILKRII